MSTLSFGPFVFNLTDMQHVVNALQTRDKTQVIIATGCLTRHLWSDGVARLGVSLDPPVS